MVPASCIGLHALQGVAAEAVIMELNLHTAQESGKQVENLKERKKPQARPAAPHPQAEPADKRQLA